MFLHKIQSLSIFFIPLSFRKHVFPLCLWQTEESSLLHPSDKCLQTRCQFVGANIANLDIDLCSRLIQSQANKITGATVIRVYYLLENGTDETQPEGITSCNDTLTNT